MYDDIKIDEKYLYFHEKPISRYRKIVSKACGEK